MRSNKRKIVLILFVLCQILLLIFLIIKLRINLEEKVKGAMTVVSLKKGDFVFDHENTNVKYYYELKPNSIIIENPEWLGTKIENQINADGLNEEKDYPVEKKANLFRVITLGDSFTFGQYVKTADNYPKKLEEKLINNLICNKDKNFEVINLGVPGYDIEYAVQRLIKKGLKYNSDLIIWLINDWNFEKIQELIKPIMSQLDEEKFLNFNPITRKFDLSDKAAELLFQKYDNEFILNYSKKEIRKTEYYYPEKILFVSFSNMKNEYKDQIEEFVRSDQSKYYYYQVSSEYRNEEYKLFDGHPNNLGYAKIAEDIFNYLHKNFFSECNLMN